MKVYLDKQPKSCRDCDFCDKKHGMCDITGMRINYFGCNVLTLKDRDKEIAKKVCDKIKQNICVSRIRKFKDIFTKNKSNLYVKYEDLKQILDQIEKGEINENNKETRI